jgi:hypothetical protein
VKKDIVVIGATAGLIGNGIKLLIAYVLYFLGLLNITFLHIVGGYFNNPNIDSIYSIINAIISDFVYAAFLGVLICIVLINTNFKKILIKGLLFGAFIHIIHNGALIFEVINRVEMDDQTGFYLIFPTIIYGLVTSLIIKRQLVG